MRKLLLRWLLVGLFVGLGVGALIGLVLSRFVQLPAVETLMAYRPIAATQVRARDGSILGSFALERRIPLTPDRIPKLYRDAVIAVEDANFYRHTGVDPQGLLRIFLRNTIKMKWSSGAHGASTITQQIPRSVGLLSREKRVIRKIKEMLLAIEIEQRLSKDQIFTLYANQINFGHGNYGVEAAARFYYGKSAIDLTLPEAALLAGLPQQPGRLSPLDYPERALARRNHVLTRMVEEKMINRAVAEKATKAPLGVEPHHERNTNAAYFIEEVRRSVEDRFGTRMMLEGGLEVETTLDPKLQEFAESAVREGLVELQRRLGWPGARRNIMTTPEEDLRRWQDAGWPYVKWQKGELVFAVVTDVKPVAAELLIAGRAATLPVAAAKWTGRTSLIRLIRPGDVILVRLLEEAVGANKPLKLELEPEPKVEGALLVLDNRTGAIQALVGGFDFNRSQFDRTMQAERQCGSAFKPFVYVAAFERGFSPADTIFDGPVLLPDEKNELTYCPINYYRQYEGIVTLRYALEHSLNASAVKLQQMISGEAVIDAAQRLGIKKELHPYSSLALGSIELPMVELTAAYAALANHGQVPEPYFIAQVKDVDGKLLLENRPRVRQAVREDVAYLTTHVMEGVIQRGTGVRALELRAHVAGKTGTTDRYTDAWFIGYSPRITCAVWVGREMKEPIGRGMTGAEAALPTWIRFMKSYFDSQPASVRAEEFLAPAGVTFIPVDRRTGLRASTACGDSALLEAVPDNKPPLECGGYWHDVVGLPWLEQLRHYTFKPGEPVTTLEAVAAAEQKLAERDSNK
jgi:penicillin-binding protein 1A